MTPSVSTLRRRAKALGYRFAKSNWRRDTVSNQGGYQIVEIGRNLVVDGVNFDCSLDDVASFLARKDAA